jgi:hypothetical protein
MSSKLGFITDVLMGLFCLVKRDYEGMAPLAGKIGGCPEGFQ